MHACLITFFLCGTNKTLRATDLLFVSNFFLSFTWDSKFITFHWYWPIKRLKFVILCESFLICPWFNATAMVCWKHLSSLLFLDLLLLCYYSFISEYLYMIHHHCLSHWHKTSMKYNEKKKLLPFIDCSRPAWYLFKSKSKSSWMISFPLLPIIIIMLPLFQCLVRFHCSPSMV